MTGRAIQRGVLFVLFAYATLAQQMPVEPDERRALEQRIAANRQQLNRGRADVTELAKELEEQERLLTAWLEHNKNVAVPKTPAQSPVTLASTPKAASPPAGIRLAVAAGQEIATANARTPSNSGLHQSAYKAMSA